jgi:hypothetical protein
MVKKQFLLCLAVLICLPMTAAIAHGQNSGTDELTADQVIARNAAARGGLEAWRAVQTMKLSGNIDAGGRSPLQLPFVMELQRPRMTRLEITFQGKKAVQVYDGTNGWKIRPFLGRNNVEPFSEAELSQASQQQELDGPLLDYAAKGSAAELLGTEPVENHPAYKLRLTLKNGQTRDIWVDAQSFLEIKMQGLPRRLDGKPHKVETWFRDYRNVDGLQVPFVIETSVDGVKDSHRMTVEKVVVNPKLAETAFTKPQPIPSGPVLAEPPLSADGENQRRTHEKSR